MKNAVFGSMKYFECWLLVLALSVPVCLSAQQEEKPVYEFDLRFFSGGNAIRGVSSPHLMDTDEFTVPAGSPTQAMRYRGPLPVQLFRNSGNTRQFLASLNLDPQNKDYLLYVWRNTREDAYAVLPISGFGELSENAIMFYNFTDVDIVARLQKENFRIPARSRVVQNPGQVENIAVTLQMAAPERDTLRRFFARTLAFYPQQRHVMMIMRDGRGRFQVSRFTDTITPEPQPAQDGAVPAGS